MWLRQSVNRRGTLNHKRRESCGEEVDCSGYCYSPKALFINSDDRLFKGPKNKRRAGRESFTQRHYITVFRARSDIASLGHPGLKKKKKRKKENILFNFQSALQRPVLGLTLAWLLWLKSRLASCHSASFEPLPEKNKTDKQTEPCSFPVYPLTTGQEKLFTSINLPFSAAAIADSSPHLNRQTVYLSLYVCTKFSAVD